MEQPALYRQPTRMEVLLAIPEIYFSQLRLEEMSRPRRRRSHTSGNANGTIIYVQMEIMETIEFSLH